jgi:hypothetical protein
MQVNFSLNPGFDALKKQLTAAQKQIEFAEIQAINKVAAAVQAALVDEMKKVYDRPTKTNLNSVKIWKAGRKENGQRAKNAIIFIRDQTPKGTPPSEYLRPTATGTEREQKPSERHLGHTSPFSSTGFFVPGRSTPLDKHGNIAPGLMSRVLSDLRGFAFGGFNQGLSDKSRKAHKGKTKVYGSQNVVFFFMRDNARNNYANLKEGIWQRDLTTGKIAPVLIAKPKIKPYKRLFKIDETAQSVVDRDFPALFQKELALAVRTAK